MVVCAFKCIRDCIVCVFIAWQSRIAHELYIDRTIYEVSDDQIITLAACFLFGSRTKYRANFFMLHSWCILRFPLNVRVRAFWCIILLFNRAVFQLLFLSTVYYY